MRLGIVRSDFCTADVETYVMSTGINIIEFGLRVGLNRVRSGSLSSWMDDQGS